MRTVLFIGSLLLLSACGSKGPLTLPPKPDKPAGASVATPAGAADHSTAAEAQR